MIFVDNLGAWRVFLMVRGDVIWISPSPANVTRELFATIIFLLLGHGAEKLKYWKVWVIWYVGSTRVNRTLSWDI